MNEIKFLEIMGKIDDALIREADVKWMLKTKSKPLISKRWRYIFGSVAAVVVITISSVALYKSNKPNYLLVDHSIIQQDNSNKNGNHSDNQGITAITNTDAITGHTTKSVADSIQNDEEHSDINGAVTIIEYADKSVPENDTSNVSVQPHRPDDSITPNNQFEQSSLKSNTETQISLQENKELKGGVAIDSGYYHPFRATVDPDSDAYSEDELHHIDVRTADGLYRQLDFDDYEANGISDTISVTDYGSYIGKIVEVNDSDYHGNSVESQEPSIAGADVYYYAPTGKNKAFIIVKKSDQCSIFFADGINVSAGFQKGLAFFNVKSSYDIQCVEYQINIPDNGIMVTAVQNSIIDSAKIEAFYNLICTLKPEDYSNLPDHIGTPQWLIDAWENYKNNPNPPAQENYRITIKLKDGTIIQDISYQPYLGNGYIENMQELTAEQNTRLKALLQ